MGRPAGEQHATISIRLPAEQLERIDQSAALHAAGNRSAYILSWVPETYDLPPSGMRTSQNKATGPHR